MNCRHCNNPLTISFCDLQASPASNNYLKMQDSPETWFPLHTFVCDDCFLVQTKDYNAADELFSSDYAYFSATSTSWLEHCKNYADNISEKLSLNEKSHVVEIASNDGYLLQFFKEKGIPCLGIEPTLSTAEVARSKGIEVITEFFGTSLAKQLDEQGRSADLIAGNNVLAHVPDINDFLKGVWHLLNSDGVATFEFPHLLNLIKYRQFDTIYHEHYSYLSLIALKSITQKVGLEIFDVENLKTHGGSLRLYLQKKDTGTREISPNVKKMYDIETEAGLGDLATYKNFQSQISSIKYDLVKFLIDQKEKGNHVVAYGAAAKGNTLLNFSGVGNDLIDYVVDRSPSKQNKYMPGSRIPIVSEEKISETKPDYILILPWNISDEITKQLDYARKWDVKFVSAIPELKVW